MAATVFVARLEPFGQISANQPAFYALSGLIARNLALIYIVIAIDQLVLSRELVTPGERLETIEEVSSFRDRVAETTGEDVLPITAPTFLDVVLTSAIEEARRIDTDSAGLDAPDRRRVDALVDAIVESGGTIDTVFEGEDIRPFTALVRALHFDYGTHLQTIGRLRTSDSIPASIDDRLSVLHDHLVLIDVGRQYFRTLYIQRELPRISRSLLYVGGPAEVALVGVCFAFMTAPSHAKVHRPRRRYRRLRAPRRPHHVHRPDLDRRVAHGDGRSLRRSHPSRVSRPTPRSSRRAVYSGAKPGSNVVGNAERATRTPGSVGTRGISDCVRVSTRAAARPRESRACGIGSVDSRRVLPAGSIAITTPRVRPRWRWRWSAFVRVRIAQSAPGTISRKSPA